MLRLVQGQNLHSNRLGYQVCVLHNYISGVGRPAWVRLLVLEECAAFGRAKRMSHMSSLNYTAGKNTALCRVNLSQERSSIWKGCIGRHICVRNYLLHTHVFVIIIVHILMNIISVINCILISFKLFVPTAGCPFQHWWK